MDIFPCGPATATCRCECLTSPQQPKMGLLRGETPPMPICEHTFDKWEDYVDEDGRVLGGSKVCSRCGLSSMEHSLWVCP